MATTGLEVEDKGSDNLMGNPTDKDKGSEVTGASSSSPIRSVPKKCVPLLPAKPIDDSVLDVGLKVKRALEMLGSAVSARPAKLARYDNETATEDSTNLGNICRELSNGDGNFPEQSNVFGRFSSFEVIPLDKLGMYERHTPLDVKAFLSRVASFNLRLWPNKPDRLSAFDCARYGWKIAAKNTLYCVSCRNMLSIPPDQGSRTLEEWTNGIEQQIQKSGHGTDCIWVRTPSPPDILALPEGNDMQNYLKEAAKTFVMMKTVPVLAPRYRLVMDKIDMTGLKNKSDLKLAKTADGTLVSVAEECAAFLILNGWCMDPGDTNSLYCTLCLRQVPLWLCQSTPLSDSLEDIADGPPKSPCTKARSGFKELNPIGNHYFWCPWRRVLQRVDPEQKMQRFLEMDNTNLFSESNSPTGDINPDLDAYMSLALKIDADFKRGRLLEGDTLELSDNAVAIRTLTNFRDLLGSLQSGHSLPKRPRVTNSQVANSDIPNEILRLKPPLNNKDTTDANQT